MITNPDLGLLPPNDAEGDGAGYVTYTVEPYDRRDDRDHRSRATATVLFNNARAAEHRAARLHLDTVAPTTQTTRHADRQRARTTR